jgi:acid phosphatase (class A)
MIIRKFVPVSALLFMACVDFAVPTHAKTTFTHCAKPTVDHKKNPFLKDKAENFIVSIEKTIGSPPADQYRRSALERDMIVAIQLNANQEAFDGAKADVTETVYCFLERMKNLDGLNSANYVVDPSLTDDVRSFFERIADTEELINGGSKDPSVIGPKPVEGLKAKFKRDRPKIFETSINQIWPTSDTSYAYPSGHATFGALTGSILTMMIPEYAPAIFVRVDDYAHSRIITGMHYPSDIQAGKIVGAELAQPACRR